MLWEKLHLSFLRNNYGAYFTTYPPEWLEPPQRRWLVVERCTSTDGVATPDTHSLDASLVAASWGSALPDERTLPKENHQSYAFCSRCKVFHLTQVLTTPSARIFPYGKRF